MAFERDAAKAARPSTLYWAASGAVTAWRQLRDQQLQKQGSFSTALMESAKTSGCLFAITLRRLDLSANANHAPGWQPTPELGAYRPWYTRGFTCL